MKRALTSALVVSLGVAACRPEAKETALAALDRQTAARQANVARQLAAPVTDSGAQSPIAVWVLPSELAEISGLTEMSDGLLLAHADERARVAAIDPRKGLLQRRFTLGAGVRGDFEGITMVGDTAFLVTSNGVIYRFLAGADGEQVRFETQDTNLGKECEFEGITWEASTSSLILACKTVFVEEFENHLLLYKVSRADARALPVPIAIPLDRVIANKEWKTLHPSDITIDPNTGNYVVIASQERAIVEVTPAGVLVRSESLPERHRQPEGVVITRDGLLVIGDEARQGSASITLYRWRPRAASE